MGELIRDWVKRHWKLFSRNRGLTRNASFLETDFLRGFVLEQAKGRPWEDAYPVVSPCFKTLIQYIPL